MRSNRKAMGTIGLALMLAAVPSTARAGDGTIPIHVVRCTLIRPRTAFIHEMLKSVESL